MNKDAKAKWLSALRSGEFKQGRLLLHEEREDTYCCLGVLCKVAGLPFSYVRAEKELGLSSITQELLMEMNDGTARFRGDKQSFSEIADYIEKTL